MFPKRLSEGYQSFLTGRLPGERSRYQALAERGQSQEVLIIGCCDSRVSPEVIFDAGPGELFVIRNVANLVPPCEIDAASSSYHGTSAAGELDLHGAYFGVATGMLSVRDPATRNFIPFTDLKSQG